MFTEDVMTLQQGRDRAAAGEGEVGGGEALHGEEGPPHGRGGRAQAARGGEPQEGGRAVVQSEETKKIIVIIVMNDYSPGPACSGRREGGEGEADGLPQQLHDGHEQELAHVARHHGPHTQRQHAAGDQQPGGRAAGAQPHHGRAHPLRLRPDQRGHQVRVEAGLVLELETKAV